MVIFLRRKGTAIFGCDEFNDSYFDKILGKLRLDKNESKLFSDEIYNEFKRMLQPVKQVIDQQYQITFSKDLQHLITSRRNYKGKIRGVARGKHTNRTFESTEEKQKIERKYKLECPNYCKELITKLRRIYKKKFYCGKGTVKLSTIHSFKGWELNIVIMILSPSPVLHENLNDELVYTGITRARVNLIVISIGENDYNDFFAQYIGNVSK